MQHPWFVKLVAMSGCALWAISGMASAADWGNLKARFVYDGKPPVAKPINITKDQEAFGNLGLVDESLLVSKDGGIANVVVYVRTADVPVNPEVEKDLKPQVKFDNDGGRFSPHILPVWVEKQQVLLHNSDPVPHNANLQPLGDEGKNPLLPPNTEVDHRFNRQQIIPVPVTCNIHPWMKGYILPRNNPYVAVSDKDGNLVLENLPAGTELEFQVWHEKVGYLDMGNWTRGRFTMKLKSGDNDLGNIKVSPALFKGP